MSGYLERASEMMEGERIAYEAELAQRLLGSEEGQFLRFLIVSDIERCCAAGVENANPMLLAEARSLKRLMSIIAGQRVRKAEFEERMKLMQELERNSHEAVGEEPRRTVWDYVPTV